MQHRKAIADDRILIVQRESDTDWSARIDGQSDSWVVGWPLITVIAEAAGYNVSHDDWPPWIDDWANEIERSS